MFGDIGGNSLSTFIVAEIGINAGGDFAMQKELIDAAIFAKADAVKFQVYFDFAPEYEFTREQWKELFEYCEFDVNGQKPIEWFASAFNDAGIDFLYEQGMKRWKIPSGFVTNHAYLKKLSYIYKKIPNCKIIISSGLCSEWEISEALQVLGDNGVTKYDLSLLQCTTVYPTPYEEVNLWVMKRWAEEYNIDVGLSDHTKGTSIPIYAAGMGAKIIEKHLTLDKNLLGPDHKASLEPHEFAEMVKSIHNGEKAMGNDIKLPTPSELKVRDEIRKKMGCKSV